MNFSAEFDRYQDLLANGYDFWDKRDYIGASRRWLEAWPVFLWLFAETGATSLREFDRKLSPEWLAINWVQDLEGALWNAGLKDPEFLHAGIRYANDYLEKFRTEDDLITENMRRALASFHCRLGETEKVDAYFEDWLSSDPGWGWGYIGWSDCYRFDCGKLDPERAESLLKRAIAIPELRDEGDVLERLKDLYDEQGRDEDANEILKRLADQPLRDENPYLSPDDGEGEDPFFDHGVVPVRREPKIGRNQPCPCGSGKKYKRCCGR